MITGKAYKRNLSTRRISTGTRSLETSRQSTCSTGCNVRRRQGVSPFRPNTLQSNIDCIRGYEPRNGTDSRFKKAVQTPRSQYLYSDQTTKQCTEPVTQSLCLGTPMCEQFVLELPSPTGIQPLQIPRMVKIPLNLKTSRIEKWYWIDLITLAAWEKRLQLCRHVLVWIAETDQTRETPAKAGEEETSMIRMFILHISIILASIWVYL